MAGVIFLDSSVLFNLLDVPGKNGDREKVVTKFQRLARDGTTFVFPITAVIETGNVIAQLAEATPVEPVWSDSWSGFARH